MRRKKLPGFGKDLHGSWVLKPPALNEWNWKPIGDSLWEAKKIEEGGYIGKEEGRKKKDRIGKDRACVNPPKMWLNAQCVLG